MLTSFTAQLFKNSHGATCRDAQLPRVRSADCNSVVCKKKSFCTIYSLAIRVSQKHSSTANLASSSVRLWCPKGLSTHPLYYIEHPFAKLLMLHWAPHQKLISCLLFDTGTKTMSPWIALTVQQSPSLGRFLWLRLSCRTNNPRVIKAADAVC